MKASLKMAYPSKETKINLNRTYIKSIEIRKEKKEEKTILKIRLIAIIIKKHKKRILKGEEARKG